MANCGARVITTVSSVERRPIPWPKTINYREGDAEAQVMDMTDGVDRIVDGFRRKSSHELPTKAWRRLPPTSAADMTPTLQFYGFMF